MKKLLALSLLLLASFTTYAQDTIFKGNNNDYVNAKLKQETFPAAKWAIILDPFATIGSGIALGTDFFMGRIQVRTLGAIHTGSAPWFYDGQSFGYSEFELSDFSGYRLELQVRKDLTEDLTESSRFGAGIFANYRSVTIKGKSTYVFNPNPGSSTVGGSTTLNGVAFTLGPIFTFSEHYKLFYFDMHLGPGMIVDIGGGDNKVVGLPLVNPYKAGVMLKFGLVIGLNMK